MAKRTTWLHVDLAGLEGDRITHTLLAHRDTLRELGWKTPVHDAEEGRRAHLELLRLHREHGMRRKEVQGTWAHLCRRAWKGRRSAVMSVPGLGAATPEQVALALDIAHGLGLHLVATTPASAADTLAVDAALAPWEVRLKPGRVHRLPVADWETAWAGVAALTGLDPVALPLSEAARRPRRPSGT